MHACKLKGKQCGWSKQLKAKAKRYCTKRIKVIYIFFAIQFFFCQKE